MRRREFDDVFEREYVFVLALLGNDDGLIALQSGYLPVDVMHFSLEKCGAIRSNNLFGHNVAERNQSWRAVL